MRSKFIFVILSLAVLSSCSRMDYTQFPLYDEIFVEQDPKIDTGKEARKPPIENPR